MKKVNVLGTEYTIEFRDYESDELMKEKEIDGYCDKSTHLIVISNKAPDCEVGNWGEVQKAVIRHEVIHAFLYESGLAASWEHTQRYGHDETVVDWIAQQFPKLLQAFQQAEAI